jgi:hypothetical protein
MYSAAMRNSSSVADNAALQQDRLVGASGALEQRKILHVAGADLDYVGILVDQVERFVIDGFGHDKQAEAVADFRHDLQSFFAQSLKRIGRGARFVGAAAEELGSGATATRSAIVNACSRLSMPHGPSNDGQPGASNGDG